MRRLGWLGVGALAFAALPAAAAAPSLFAARNAAVFERAWALVGGRYWDRTMHGVDWAAARALHYPRALAAPDSRSLYAVINEMLGTLGDSHVYAISPERIDYARDRSRAGGDSGFGFDAFKQDGKWFVHTLDRGGPAATAGVEIGWRLISVDGQPVDIDRHFGDGDSATLLFEDENGRRHAVALRGVPLAAEPDRQATRLDGDVLLLAFDQFGDGEARWLARRLADRPAPSAVILDLRENGGGEADALDRIAGLFVPDRRVVLRTIARRVQEERTAGAGSRAYRGPLAVLIGPRTASAAEALAAFLDEAGRAATIGEATAGELTGGIEYHLPDGGRLTVAQFDVRTPGGQRLEGKGLIPRYPVKPTLAQLRGGEDPVVARALAVVRHARGAP